MISFFRTLDSTRLPMLTTSQRRQFCQNHPRSPHRNGNDDDDDDDDDEDDDLGDNEDDVEDAADDGDDEYGVVEVDEKEDNDKLCGL